MPNSNDMSDFTCQCTDTMVATCTSSFASAYLCAAVVAIAVALARVCTCDLSDDSDSDDDGTSDAVKSSLLLTYFTSLSGWARKPQPLRRLGADGGRVAPTSPTRRGTGKLRLERQ